MFQYSSKRNLWDIKKCKTSRGNRCDYTDKNTKEDDKLLSLLTNEIKNFNYYFSQN